MEMKIKVERSVKIAFKVSGKYYRQTLESEEEWPEMNIIVHDSETGNLIPYDTIPQDDRQRIEEYCWEVYEEAKAGI